MKPRSIPWLRRALFRDILVLGEVDVSLFLENRFDLIPEAAMLSGYDYATLPDRITFFANPYQGPMLHPMRAVEPVLTKYQCKYEHIHSVYEDVDGSPVVVLKDALLGNRVCLTSQASASC
jgi:hypothetical protein